MLARLRTCAVLLVLRDRCTNPILGSRSDDAARTDPVRLLLATFAMLRALFCSGVLLLAACSDDNDHATTVATTGLSAPPPNIVLPVPIARTAVTLAGSLDGTFAVTGDGAAEYTVTLAAPTGREGIEPHLSLAYS